MNDGAEEQSYPNDRILVIDDNPAIHEDFRKILSQRTSSLESEMEEVEAALFGEEQNVSSVKSFEIDSASQGQDGLQMIRNAWKEGRPYSVAFIDVRMPPGWDGIETIMKIWEEFQDLQIVICTAYSDYSWDEIAQKLGTSDHVLVLKKPFDSIEVLQMAHALSKKWELARIAARQMQELDELVQKRTQELREANARLKGEVAERLAAEQELRVSEERFSKAFHGSPVAMGIQRLDAPGFLDVNSRFLEVLGTDREFVLMAQQPWLEPSAAEEIAAKLADGLSVRDLPSRVTRMDGETRDVLIAADTLELGGKPYHLLILQDITERIRLENQLRQAQKMEAVGRLAAGVAHDFNNILTVIMGNTSLHLSNAMLDEKLAQSLNQVVRAAERATELTRQLLAYSRNQIIQRRPVALSSLVEQTISMLRRILGEHVVINADLRSDLPNVFADPSNVDQVVMNLALNARDAMPGGGLLHISIDECEVTESAGSHSPDAVPGHYARLSVRDTGHGMDASTLQRIFEPFYTTKEPGKGTGMGLATVYGVLRQHNGWVEVESSVGRGSTFRAYFPFASSDAVETAQEAPEQICVEIHRHSGKILVVEDEEMLREYVQDALTEMGYAVICAANGEEALALWAIHRDEIDLLFTDVVMPNSVSGVQLAHELMMQKPDLRVIYTSGYSSELIGTDFEQDERCGFLPKPYLTDRLTNAVARQLSRRLPLQVA